MQIGTARRLAIAAILTLVVAACGNPSNVEAESGSDGVVATETTEDGHEDEATEDGYDEATDDGHDGEAIEDGQGVATDDGDDEAADDGHDEATDDGHDEATDDGHDDEAVDGDDHTDHDHDEAGHSADAFAFGSPADPSEADRVIEVDANDDLTFGPNEFEVSAGETVQFVITNTGVIPHDFTLGDKEAQEAHEQEMAKGAMEHNDPNAVVLEPGETASLTWSFTQGGTVLIGCHQPGHYAGGMTGIVDVGT